MQPRVDVEEKKPNEYYDFFVIDKAEVCTMPRLAEDRVPLFLL